jgi:hypothetical protein
MTGIPLYKVPIFNAALCDGKLCEVQRSSEETKLDDVPVRFDGWKRPKWVLPRQWVCSICPRDLPGSYLPWSF